MAVAISMTNGSPNALVRGTPVTVNDDGEAIPAYDGVPVYGMVRDRSIASGESGRVALSGIVSATDTYWEEVTGVSGGLEVGREYFLGTTGRLTTSTGGPLVGIALSDEAMLLRIGGDTLSADVEEAERVDELEDAFKELVQWLCVLGFEVPERLIVIAEEK